MLEVGAKKFTYVFNTGEDLCPVLWSRPPHTSLVPSQTIEHEGQQITAARHHIIPYDTLRGFFLLALRESREDSHLGPYLARRIRRIVNQYVSNQQSIQYQPPVAVEDIIIEVDPNEEMHAALSWLPGNIFMGPPPALRHRDDPTNQHGGDPGNAFEAYSNTIVRNDDQFTALRALNRDMQLYPQNPSADLFDQIMENLDVVNERDSPYQYNPDDWELRNGEYYIKPPSGVNHPRNGRSIGETERSVRRVPSGKTDSEDPFVDFEDFCFDLKKQLFTGNGFGDETAAGHWNNVYKVSFSFTVGGKVYLYGHNLDTYYWFIQEFTADGKLRMGSETAAGHWNNAYEVQFPFMVGGKTYFYCHNTDSKYWFIQELLDGGRMGEETANGHWNNVYKIQFPLTVAGKTYFYGQNLDSYNWFIQELRPGGIMGSETANGFWNNAYGVQFSIVVGGRTYFYGKNLDTKYWFIQEILPGGRLGDETHNGRGDEPFKVEAFHGFVFGQNQASKRWQVREVRPDGKLGSLISAGYWDNAYEVLVPFFIHGKTYLYAHNTDSKYWFIQRML